MVFKASGKPNNLNTLGLLGYLIVANKQIHNYQLEALEEYLTSIETNIFETCLNEILDGRDDSISFATSLSAYETETPEVKKDIYYMLLVLALVDNSIDENEGGVISAVFDKSALTDEQNDAIKELAASDASEIRKIRNTLFIRKKTEEQPKLNWIQKILRWFDALLKRLSGKENIVQPYPEEIEYKTAIDQCAVVASEDFSSLNPIYKHILDSCIGIINEIKAYKRSLSLETGYSADVAEVITTFADILNNDVLGQCQQAQVSLDQKRRTVSDFTISLLGRTKAGKSTLHAILTNEGREKIGEGRQRTTRYNRVYQWNLLRLIDTPGIGSAEAAGRTDDEIAQSVLGESDIICVVVVDDSILRDVLEFIEKIAELNKPIIILLNHKENIRPEVKYKRFLSNPREWLETEGEANLNGHISRILKYAEDHGFASLIKVYPVFLLSALMSSEKKYAEDSNLLWESSNIEAFIEQLKDWITVYGKIKRSQTILDEAIQVLARSIRSIEEAKALLIEQRDKLIRQQKEKLSSLEDIEQEVYTHIKEVLEEKFDKLAKQDALDFAEEEYGCKGNHAEHWKNYVERIGFEQEVIDSVNTEIQVYSEKVADVVTSLFEDLYYSAKISICAHKIDIPILFDFRTATRLLGGIAGTVGAILLLVLGNTNPIGWVVSAVGVVLELGSMLFKTKEQKRQTAINKVYESVKKSIEDSAPEAIKQILKEIQSSLSENTKKVEMLFEDLEKGLDKVAAMAEQLQTEYVSAQVTLNQLYAFRLVQFIESQHGTSGVVLQDIIAVDRNQSGKILIQTSDAIEPVEAYSLEGIITEKIFIERRTKE